MNKKLLLVAGKIFKDEKEAQKWLKNECQGNDKTLLYLELEGVPEGLEKSMLDLKPILGFKGWKIKT